MIAGAFLFSFGEFKVILRNGKNNQTAAVPSSSTAA
jgi:hypothetical protein